MDPSLARATFFLGRFLLLSGQILLLIAALVAAILLIRRKRSSLPAWILAGAYAVTGLVSIAQLVFQASLLVGPSRSGFDPRPLLQLFSFLDILALAALALGFGLFSPGLKGELR